MSLLTALLPNLTRPAAAQSDQVAAAAVPSVRPAYEIKEAPDAWAVTVYLPGVARDGLELTAEEGQVRIVGRRAWQQPEGWTTLHRETHATASFELVLSHDNALDADKITAELNDGVLRISLPKAEAVKPRKIAVS